MAVEAIVEFDYTAQEPDELTIHKGDIITNIKQMEGGWWEGMVHGKKGVFPDNFVKVVTKDNQDDKSNVQMRKAAGRQQRRCRVMFSYKPVNEDELELHESDVIEILGEVEEGWWRGKLNTKVGVFPSNFVKEIFDPEPKADPVVISTIAKTKEPDNFKLITEETTDRKEIKKDTTPHKETDTAKPQTGAADMCIVRYAYAAVNPDELSLQVGERVAVLSRHTQEPGWWRGELNGKQGVFPDNFVELCAPSPADSSLPPPTQEAHKSSPSNQKVHTSSDSPSAKPCEDHVDKVDDKPPPVLGKKPAAPPPSKKPPAPAVVVSRPLSKPADAPDGAAHSHAPRAPAATKGGASEFDNVERGAMLTHVTASRAKAPRRRPPSAVFKDSETSNGVMNGSAEDQDDDDEEEGAEEGRATSLSPASNAVPLAARLAMQQQKAPWVEELRQNQARSRKVQQQQPEPPPQDKKPAVLPTKPSEARLKPATNATPTVALRSPQQAQPPPLSSPRHSVLTEQTPPVANKRPPSDPPITAAVVAASNGLPESALLLRNDENAVPKLCAMVAELQKQVHKLTHDVAGYELAKQEDRRKMADMQSEIERLKARTF